MKIKIIFIILLIFLFTGAAFAYEKLDVNKDECYLIEYDTKETIHKMPDKWYDIWRGVAEKEIKEAKKNNNNGQVKAQEAFLKKIDIDHTGAIVNKKSLFIGNNDFGLWCEDFKGINIDQSYFCNNKGYSYGSLSTYIDYNLEKKEGWGTSIHFIKEKPFFDNFPFLGFDTNYNTLVDNRLLYKEVHLKVEKDSVTLMDAENVYIKYVFGSNEMIPKKVVIDYYCDYDFTYHQRTLELTLSKIEKYKVADLLKDIYHPDEVTSVTKDNKVVTYYPGEESTIEVLNKDNEIPKKAIVLSYILKIVLLILIIFILVRLFSKVAKKKEGK
ncbi:MAG: hypothetical protein IJS60_05415 [Abditibacteriota bacterium]|nr:hypothetical protein [Abditibacteriota bacterium]